MKIEIPDEWFAEMTGCELNTTPKEAAMRFSRFATNKQYLHAYVGEYVLHQILCDNYEKS